MVLRAAIARLEGKERVVAVDHENERDMPFKGAMEEVLRTGVVAVFKSRTAAFGVKGGVTVSDALVEVRLCGVRDDLEAMKAVDGVLEVWKFVIGGGIDGAHESLFRCDGRCGVRFGMKETPKTPDFGGKVLFHGKEVFRGVESVGKKALAARKSLFVYGKFGFKRAARASGEVCLGLSGHGGSCAGQQLRCWPAQLHEVSGD